MATILGPHRQGLFPPTALVDGTAVVFYAAFFFFFYIRFAFAKFTARKLLLEKDPRFEDPF